MGLSKAHAAIDEQWVVHLPGGFGHSKSCRVSQVVVGSHDKGVKGVSGIQVGGLDGSLAHIQGIGLDQLLFRFRVVPVFYGILCDKIHSALESGHFLNGHLKDESVFSPDVSDHIGIRRQDGDDRALNRVDFQWKKPGSVRNIKQFVLFFQVKEDIIPLLY